MSDVVDLPVSSLVVDPTNPRGDAGDVAELDITQADLAKRLGVSQPRMAQRLKLLELPDDVQQLVADGVMSIGAGYKLAKSTRGALTKERKRKTVIDSDDVGVLAPVILSDRVVVAATAAAKERREAPSDLIARAVRREVANPSCRKCEQRPALTGIGTSTLCQPCRVGR